MIQLQNYYVANGTYPYSFDELYEEGQESYKYIDGWGVVFYYCKVNSITDYTDEKKNAPYILYSLGMDKRKGGFFYAKDICSWEL